MPLAIFYDDDDDNYDENNGEKPKDGWQVSQPAGTVSGHQGCD